MSFPCPIVVYSGAIASRDADFLRLIASMREAVPSILLYKFIG